MNIPNSFDSDSIKAQRLMFANTGREFCVLQKITGHHPIQEKQELINRDEQIKAKILYDHLQATCPCVNSENKRYSIKGYLTLRASHPMEFLIYVPRAAENIQGYNVTWILTTFYKTHPTEFDDVSFWIGTINILTANTCSNFPQLSNSTTKGSGQHASPCS